MKKIALLLVSIVGALAACAVEIHCTGCNAKVLPGDKFCPNCGARFEEPSRVEPPPTPKPVPQYLPPNPKPKTEQSEYWNEVENHKPGHALPVPLGMLRGLAEIACSPLELARSASILESSLLSSGQDSANKFFGTLLGVPTGMCIMGGVGVTLDVVFGALDVVSFGTLGNAYWNDDRSTPYIFGRYWTTGSHYTKGVWF